MSQTSKRVIAGRVLISLVAVQLLFGCFYFDYNETHVFNPHWTDHSRFHTAMTIYMGAMLAVLGIYYTWRRAGDARTNLQAAAWFTSIYFLSFFPSALMPGSALSEPGMNVPLVDRRARWLHREDFAALQKKFSDPCDIQKLVPLLERNG